MSLPPSLAHNTPTCAFPQRKNLLANEARYLFFTENGPVEIAFRPYKALKITGGLAGLILMLIIAGPVLYKHLPEMMPERDMATDIAANITTDIAKVITAPVNQPVISGGSPLFSDTIDTLKDLALRVSIPSPTQPDSPAPAIAPAPPQNITDQVDKLMLPNILPNNSIDTSAAQVLAQPSPVIEERPEDYVTARPPSYPFSPACTQKSNHCANTSSKSGKNGSGICWPDSLSEAPYLDSRVQLHRLFADYLSQARQVERIIERFDIRLDNTPDSWPLAAEPADELVSKLFLHRDSWIKVLNQLPLKSPLRYYYITSPYGMRTNKKTGVTRFHHGIDLAGTWRAELRPSASGVVSFAGRDGSFGKIVRVRHAHNIETVYAHLSAINVKTGDFVTDNVVIGKMGNTGRSDGMHLHYEILINNKSIDPALFFKIGHQLSNTGGLPRAISF